MKRAVLTGAGGFVAHHVLEHLLVNTGWDVIATDSFRHQGKTDRITEVLAARPDQAHRVEVITHDLTAPFSAQMTRRIGHIDYLIAVAAESHVDRSHHRPGAVRPQQRGRHAEHPGTRRELKPRSGPLVSTDEVYGPINPGDDPYPEWAPILPPTRTARARQPRKPRHLVVADLPGPGHPHEPDQPARRAAVHGEIHPLGDPLILAGETVRIHGTPDEIGTRYYMHARNAADASCSSSARPSRPCSPQRSGPTGTTSPAPKPVSNLELALEIAAIIGKPFKYELTGWDVKGRRP